jgi:hypothetical protein
MPDLSTWTIYVRDASLATVAQVDDYQFLDMVPRFNDIGTWILDMDARVGGAANLLQDGAGIVVTRYDPAAKLTSTVLSGPVAFRERDFGGDPDRNRLKVKGFDDNVWLLGRIAHPQPTTSAPPYNSQAYDVRTGVCSTVLRQYVDFNLGPSALNVRQVPGLTLAADPGLGPSVTGRARWDPLPDLLRTLALAGGDLGFQIQQVGTGIQFQVYQPVDRSTSVIFSPDLANLAAYDWSEARPKANYIFCGGSGQDTARVIQEGQDSSSVARWGRIEMFRDRRDTAVAAELTQTIGTELLNNQGAVVFSITPQDLPQMSYLTHYNLGDRVTVYNDGIPFSNIIREVHISIGNAGGSGGGVFVTPLIGTPGRSDQLQLIDQIRRIQNRLVTLERI